MVQMSEQKTLKTHRYWVFSEAEVYAILREKIGLPPSAISETRGGSEFGFEDIIIHYTETEEIS